MRIPILYEDKDVIVCNKPVGMLVQSGKTLDIDMINELKNYVYENEKRNDEPYIGLIQRLDRPVGGVLVFAKSQYAAKNLSEQLRDKRLRKKYYAVVTKDLSPFVGKEKVHLINYLIKDKKTNLSYVVPTKQGEAKRAELWYQVLSVANDDDGKPISLVEVDLVTGRHHQIRVQLSEAGLPLWGDTKYNKEYQADSTDSKQSIWFNIGLFSHNVSFYHPRTKKELVFNAVPGEGVFPKFEPFFSIIVR